MSTANAPSRRTGRVALTGHASGDEADKDDDDDGATLAGAVRKLPAIKV
jgi:hypothetical protein